MWERIEDRLALLELLVTGRLRRRLAQEAAFETLLQVPWIHATGRRDEVALVDERRNSVIDLMERVWPEWRLTLHELVTRGHTPTPDGWTHLQDELRAEDIERLPSLLNKHTAAALVAPHSKAVLTERRREALGDVTTTHDGTVRLRAPPGIVARTVDGASVDLASLTQALGEVAIAERAFLAGARVDGPLRAVLLVENLGAWRDLPAQDAWLYAFVAGWDTPTVIRFLEHIPTVPVVHFGDLDPNGVLIYQHLRKARRDLLWLVPDFWHEHIELRAQHAEWPRGIDISDGPQLVRDLAARGLWLEQECIVVDPRLRDALDALIR